MKIYYNLSSTVNAGPQALALGAVKKGKAEK